MEFFVLLNLGTQVRVKTSMTVVHDRMTLLIHVPSYLATLGYYLEVCDPLRAFPEAGLKGIVVGCGSTGDLGFRMGASVATTMACGGLVTVRCC